MIKNNITQEAGFVLVTAMMMLVVLSLIGIAAVKTTTFEIQLAGNELAYQEKFYFADAGVNAVLAQNVVPNDTFLPSSYANPFIDCNNPQDQQPFTSFDLDSDTIIDVDLYLLTKSGNPVEIDVASCASQQNTMVELLVGVQYGTPPGSQVGTGDINEYSN